MLNSFISLSKSSYTIGIEIYSPIGLRFVFNFIETKIQKKISTN